MLFCFNILDVLIDEEDVYIDMDNEKQNNSDKLTVYGEIDSSDYYVKTLVEHAENLGKGIQYVIQ